VTVVRGAVVSGGDDGGDEEKKKTKEKEKTIRNKDDTFTKSGGVPMAQWRVAVTVLS
jgi:hypothetical protein